MNSVNVNSVKHSPPVALTIAGSDSGGGAGIQADLKTFAAFGVFGCSAITALTAQNTQGVQGVHPVPAEFVVEQIHSVMNDFSVNAIKTGMLANAEIIRALVSLFESFHFKSSDFKTSDRPAGPALVIDPVMLATSGDRLLEREAESLLIHQLLPQATLITPNLPEAAALLSAPIAENEAQCWHQAEQLLALGPKAVLLKGGHGTGAEATDRLLLADGQRVTFSRPRLTTHNSHGSGCTLGAAITAGLARGADLVSAVENAKDYLHQALASGARWHLGQGAGPLNHFYHLRAFAPIQESPIPSFKLPPGETL